MPQVTLTASSIGEGPTPYSLMEDSSCSQSMGWKASAWYYLRTVDDYLFGFGNAAEAIEKAVKKGDKEGAFRGKVERVQAYASLTNYSLKILRKAAEVTLMSGFSPFLIDGAVLELGLSGIEFTKGSYAIYKQARFLSTISKVNTTKEGLVFQLRKLGSLGEGEFENRLEKEFIEEHGEVSSKTFKALADRIQANGLNDKEAVEKAEKLMGEIKSQATKKLFVHLIEVIGALVGIVGTLLIIYVRAHLDIIFIGVAIAFQLIRFIAVSGWMNHDEFSPIECIPVQIRNICNNAYEGIRTRLAISSDLDDKYPEFNSEAFKPLKQRLLVPIVVE